MIILAGLPTEVGGWVSVLPSELEAVLYHPRREEWPGGDRAAACHMIASGLDQVTLPNYYFYFFNYAVEIRYLRRIIG